jgi:hypothetical protein
VASTPNGERRSHPKRIGAVGTVCSEDRLRPRNEILLNYLTCHRESGNINRVRLPQLPAGDDRSEIAQPNISHNHILFTKSNIWSEQNPLPTYLSLRDGAKLCRC